MDFRYALFDYNAHHSTKISSTYIASNLKNEKTGNPLSKQAFWELTNHGGKKGLIRYKEQLEKILPRELFEKIEFPKKKRVSLAEKKSSKCERVAFSDEERKEIIEYPYIVSAGLRRKIFENVLVSKGIHDRTMALLEEEKKRLEGLGV